jgi:hypothetical protein
MSAGRGACVAKTRKKKFEREQSSSIFFGHHAKVFGDQCDLPSYIPFGHALELSFPQYVHYLALPRKAEVYLRSGYAHRRSLHVAFGMYCMLP